MLIITFPLQQDINNTYPAGIYMLKVNNKNTRTRCELLLTLDM